MRRIATLDTECPQASPDSTLGPQPREPRRCDMARECSCDLQIIGGCNCCEVCYRSVGCDPKPSGRPSCLGAGTLARAGVRHFLRGYIRASADLGQLDRDLPTSKEELVSAARALNDPASAAALEIDPPWRVFRSRDGGILIDWLDGSALEPIPTPTVSTEADGARSDILGEASNRGAVWGLLKVAGFMLLLGYSIGYGLWLGLAILGLTLGLPDSYLPSPHVFAIGLPAILLVGFVILCVGSLISNRRRTGQGVSKDRVDSANGPRRRSA